MQQHAARSEPAERTTAQDRNNFLLSLGFTLLTLTGLLFLRQWLVRSARQEVPEEVVVAEPPVPPPPVETFPETRPPHLLLVLFVAASILLATGAAHLVLFGDLAAALDEWGLTTVASLFPRFGGDPFATYATQPPPIPVLQEATVADRVERTARNEALLHSYGWVEPEAGIAHIPIERAMHLVVERSLPQEATPAAGPDPAATGDRQTEGE